MKHHNTRLKTSGIIFYSDGLIKDPIKSAVQRRLDESDLPITSSVLGPEQKRSYPQMVKQIIDCLERSEGEYVFFCEADVLYSKSHFEFVPPKDDIFYYNSNVWRWDYPGKRFFTYDRLLNLSALCVNRLFALEHFKRRLEKIVEMGQDKPHRGEPVWLRKMGYEPGTKKKKRGGFSDDDFDVWYSEGAIIDIRHDKNFSPRKVTLERFKHPPTGWREMIAV